MTGRLTDAPGLHGPPDEDEEDERIARKHAWAERRADDLECGLEDDDGY
jgi:hypothetical protein